MIWWSGRIQTEWFALFQHVTSCFFENFPTCGSCEMYVSEKLKTSDYSTGFRPSGKRYSTEEGTVLDSSISLVTQLPNNSYTCCFLVLCWVFLSHRTQPFSLILQEEYLSAIQLASWKSYNKHHSIVTLFIHLEYRKRGIASDELCQSLRSTWIACPGIHYQFLHTRPPEGYGLIGESLGNSNWYHCDCRKP